MLIVMNEEQDEGEREGRVLTRDERAFLFELVFVWLGFAAPRRVHASQRRLLGACTTRRQAALCPAELVYRVPPLLLSRFFCSQEGRMCLAVVI